LGKAKCVKCGADGHRTILDSKCPFYVHPFIKTNTTNDLNKSKNDDPIISVDADLDVISGSSEIQSFLVDNEDIEAIQEIK
jgi:hypothetical protein